MFIFAIPEELARPPVGLDYAAQDSQSFVSDPETHWGPKTVEVLEKGYSQCQERSRQMHTKEGVGVVLEKGAYCQYLEKDGVLALFAGEVAIWPTVDAVAEAHDAFMRGEEPLHDDVEWLLDFYNSFSIHANVADITEAALRALARVQGSYAFVLWDTTTRRVWAARDSMGSQPLYWGTTPDGMLMFGTDPAKLDLCCQPSAAPFPAGTLFASSGNTMAVNPGEEGWVIYGEPHPGSLLSFVESASPVPGHHWRDIKAIPRMKSTGELCGAVYRVASERQLAGAGGIRGF